MLPHFLAERPPNGLGLDAWRFTRKRFIEQCNIFGGDTAERATSSQVACTHLLGGDIVWGMITIADTAVNFTMTSPTIMLVYRMFAILTIHFKIFLLS